MVSLLNGNISKKAKEHLDLLHSADIYHGDIKISNILYEDGQFYFIDFGFSHVDSEINSDLTDRDLKALEGMTEEVLNESKKNFSWYLALYFSISP